MDKDSKICASCNNTKPLADFRSRTDRPGRTQSACKQCVKKYNAARYLAKRDQLRTQVADWQRANRVRVRFNTAEYSAKNPELRRAMKHRRRALALAAGVVQFSPNQWHERLKYFGSKCWMCGGPFEHIDHVKPLSRGGPHMLANLRPSCARCNLTKRDKWFGPLDLARFTK